MRSPGRPNVLLGPVIALACLASPGLAEAGRVVPSGYCTIRLDCAPTVRFEGVADERNALEAALEGEPADPVLVLRDVLPVDISQVEQCSYPDPSDQRLVHCSRGSSRLVVDAFTVDGGDGDDELRVPAGFVEGGAGDDLIVGAREASGGPGDDRLVGGDEDNVFVADASPDGADSYEGGAGIDGVSYAARTRPVKLTLGASANDGQRGERDRIAADVENVIGGSGNDTLVGDANRNRLEGLKGDDRLDGRSGGDELYGASGRDRLIGGPGRDFLHGGSGRNLLLMWDDWVDVGTCGNGRTRAIANARDILSNDCIVVVERRPFRRGE